ncbi:MAG: VanW family protein [Clostridia bacterium]|nr:VanW family protein [Clostridia bacterium]
MNKKIRLAAIVISIFLILSIFALVYIYPLYNFTKILDNVYINEINMGGLTKEQAIDKLIALSQNLADNFSIDLTYGEKMWIISSDDLNYDPLSAIDSAVSEAIEYGHNGTLVERIAAIRSAHPVKIPCNLLYDEASIVNMLEHAKSELVCPFNPDAVTFSPQAEKTYTIDDLTALNYIPQESIEDQAELDNLNSYLKTVFEYNLDAPVYEMNVEKTLDKILEDLSYDNIADVELAIEKGDNYYSIDELKNRTTLVYHSSSGIAYISTYDRDCNITTALGRFDGYVLYPGSQLSFNEIALEINIENGYKIAPGISSSPLTFQGITQASTIILNAAIMSCCDIIERNSHAYPVYTANDDYAQCGLDSFVEWGEKDLIVKNNTNYPIYFDTYVHWTEIDSASYAYCNVYTMPLPDGRKYVIESVLEYEGEMPEPIYTEITNENELPGYNYEVYRDDNLGKMVYTLTADPLPKRIYGVYRIIKDAEGAELSREKLYDAVYEEITLEAFLLPIPEE